MPIRHPTAKKQWFLPVVFKLVDRDCTDVLSHSFSQESYKASPISSDYELYMQAHLCCALAAKGQQDYKAACSQLVECENLLKQRCFLIAFSPACALLTEQLPGRLIIIPV